MNRPLPTHRRMQFRIGINLGDVIEQEDGTIYGDGVNVAARLQEFSEPGGICISGPAYDHVEGKLPLAFKSIGEQPVKNIAKPVRAYRVIVGVSAGKSRRSLSRQATKSRHRRRHDCGRTGDGRDRLEDTAASLRIKAYHPMILR